jgi:hypothetical protein
MCQMLYRRVVSDSFYRGTRPPCKASTEQEDFMLNACKAIFAAAVLQTLSSVSALAQTGQMPMPVDWQMTWPMALGCILVVLVLLLAAAALIKYLFFR